MLIISSILRKKFVIFVLKLVILALKKELAFLEENVAIKGIDDALMLKTKFKKALKVRLLNVFTNNCKKLEVFLF